MTRRMAPVACTVLVTVAIAATAASTFISTWKAPDAGPLNFAGRKVAALVIVDDESLRMSAEEALAREITARGPVGVAAYRIVPREELTDKDRARTWFEKATVEGLVVLRLVDTDTQKVYSSMVWTSGYYGNAWDYYGNGWAAAYPLGKGRNETTITVETLLYDLGSGRPIWAGVSRTTDPKNVGSYIKELSQDVVKSLEKEKLVKKGGK